MVIGTIRMPEIAPITDARRKAICPESVVRIPTSRAPSLLTAVAALVVGTVEAFSSFYASNFKEVIVFTLILPVLVLRSLAAPAVEEEKD